MLLQDFGLEPIQANTARSPAGFGFDLTALLDDSVATKQQTQSKLGSSVSRCRHFLWDSARTICLYTTTVTGMSHVETCRQVADPTSRKNVEPQEAKRLQQNKPHTVNTERSSLRTSQHPQVHFHWGCKLPVQGQRTQTVAIIFCICRRTQQICKVDQASISRPVTTPLMLVLSPTPVTRLPWMRVLTC